MKKDIIGVSFTKYNIVSNLALVLRRTIKILYTKNRYKILLWIKQAQEA